MSAVADSCTLGAASYARVVLRDNNFTALRFLAASAVIVSHSYPLTGIEWEPFHDLTGGFSLGALAVQAFFAISGYFIYASFDRRPDEFLVARALRLIPAMAVMGVIVGILLPLFFAAPPDPAFAARAASVAFPSNTIPGLFQDNPNTGANGPLWTLHYEVLCYAMVFLAGVAGLLKRYWLFLMLWAAAYFLVPGPAALLSFPFVVGMTVYRLGRRSVPGILGFAVVAALVDGSALPLWGAGIALGSLALGFAPWRYPVRNDYSYGIYIYGWPIQQTLVALWPTIAPFQLMLAALPIAILFGALSWHLIEAPALRLRSAPALARLTKWR